MPVPRRSPIKERLLGDHRLSLGNMSLGSMDTLPEEDRLSQHSLVVTIEADSDATSGGGGVEQQKCDNAMKASSESIQRQAKDAVMTSANAQATFS